jgi:amidase
MRRLFNTALAGASMLAVSDLPQGRAEMQARQVELLEATVPQLQAALTAGTVTSRDLVAMYLARIDAYDQRGPALNAISLTNGNALIEADARDAERRAGAQRRALQGIPVIVKDNYDTADLQTAAGSRSLAGWVPPDEAFLVKKLREAGAIIIAKSNMHEFAYGIATLGSLFGQTTRQHAGARPTLTAVPSQTCDGSSVAPYSR